jgi:hypothetical protein
MSALKSLNLVVLFLRIATAAAVITPFAVYYASSGSLEGFLFPKTDIQLPNLKFDILSYNVSKSNNGYVLDLKLLNTGNVAFGITGIEGEVSLVNQDFKGRFSLESPIVLSPAREGSIRVVLLPVQGDLKTLEDALSRDEAFNVTGRATITLSDAELPFSFTAVLKPSEVGERGGF